jgi:hypothetical protein
MFEDRFKYSDFLGDKQGRNIFKAVPGGIVIVARYDVSAAIGLQLKTYCRTRHYLFW